MTDPTFGDLRYIILAAALNLSSMFCYLVLFSAQPRWRSASRFDRIVSVLVLGSALGNMPTLAWIGWAVCQPHVRTSPPWVPSWVVLAPLLSCIVGLVLIIPTAVRYAMPDYACLMAASYLAALGAIHMLADIDGQHRASGVLGVIACLLVITVLVGSLICHQTPNLPHISKQSLRAPLPTPVGKHLVPMTSEQRARQDEFGRPFGEPVDGSPNAADES